MHVYPVWEICIVLDFDFDFDLDLDLDLNAWREVNEQLLVRS